MIAALLTLTLAASNAAPHAAGALTQVPTDASVPTALRTSDVRATIQLSRTHFAARSISPQRQWLIFENREAGLRATRALKPFAELIYPLEGLEAASGMTVAVATEDIGGQIALGTPESCLSFLDTTLFVERNGAGVHSWIARHGGRSLTRSAASASTHVPVPVPSEDKQREKRRKVEGKKLPPL